MALMKRAMVLNVPIAAQPWHTDDPRLEIQTHGIENHRWLHVPSVPSFHARHAGDSPDVPIVSTTIVPHALRCKFAANVIGNFAPIALGVSAESVFASSFRFIMITLCVRSIDHTYSLPMLSKRNTWNCCTLPLLIETNALNINGAACKVSSCGACGDQYCDTSGCENSHFQHCVSSSFRRSAFN